MCSKWGDFLDNLVSFKGTAPSRRYWNVTYAAHYAKETNHLFSSGTWASHPSLKTFNKKMKSA